MDEGDYEPDGWYDRGYLPHLDNGTPTFVTFRLNDSLPLEVLDDIEDSDACESTRRPAIEGRLDEGHGECVLAIPEVAEIAAEALTFFDGERYRLHEWVIMPNHVHSLLGSQTVPLKEILHSWKSYSSQEIQKVLPEEQMPKEGRLWQAGFYDRTIRDNYHFWCVERYILLNPVRAGVCEAPWEWLWSSAAEKDDAVEGAALRRWFRHWEDRFDDLPFEMMG